MSKFYTKTLRGTVLERVESMIQEKLPVEQLDLTEELALLRVVADDVGEQYAKASMLPEGEKKDALIIGVGQHLAESIERVVKVCESSAKVQEARQKIKGAFAGVMADVVQTITKAAWETFHDDFKVKEFEQRLREVLSVADVQGAVGTSSTPDQDVAEMDSMVPAREVDSQ